MSRIAYCNNCEKTVASTKISKNCKECGQWLYLAEYVSLSSFKPARQRLTPMERASLRAAGFDWCAVCRSKKPVAEVRTGTCRTCALEQSRSRAGQTEPGTKLCTKCNRDRNSFYFHKNSARPDGLAVYCKDCHVKYRRSLVQQDPFLRFKKNIKRRVRLVFEKGRIPKESSLVDIIGCDYPTLWNHLTNNGTISYNPQILSIDHIVPVSQAQNAEEVLKLQTYRNLRLITKEANATKSNKATPEGVVLCIKLLGREWAHE